MKRKDFILKRIGGAFFNMNAHQAQPSKYQLRNFTRYLYII